MKNTQEIKIPEQERFKSSEKILELLRKYHLYIGSRTYIRDSALTKLYAEVEEALGEVDEG